MLRDFAKYEFRVKHEGCKLPWSGLSPLVIDLTRISPDDRHDAAFDIATSFSIRRFIRPDNNQYEKPREVRWNRMGSVQGHYFGAGYRRD